MTGAQQAFRAGVREGVRQERIRAVARIDEFAEKSDLDLSGLRDEIDIPQENEELE